MTIPVFRKGQWIHYTPPATGLQLWSQALLLQVASVYATAVTKGISLEQSCVLAECYANKQLYGVTYMKTIEDKLQSLLV